MTLQNIKISLRSDSLENWISSDPVLKNGELVMVNDISAGLVRFKIGNGVSAFVQLPYVNEKKVITNFAKAKRTESQYFSQGVNNFTSPLGFAAGSYLTADSSFAQVLGINACALEGHDYSFVWNGDGSGTIGVQSYRSHGEGTFNVNPVDGVNGIYIGNQTLSGILSSTCQPKGNYLSSNALDGYKTYNDTKLSLSGDGYATQTQLDAKSAISVDNELANVNILHISQEEYNQLVDDDATLSNTIYIISSEYIEAFGQQIKNVAPPTDLSDAVNKEYVDSNFQPAGSYLTAHQPISVAYADQHIKLSANGQLIGDIDCADFIKDGMLSSAELCGTTLVLKFNTDAGSAPVSVQLSDFVDDYDEKITDLSTAVDGKVYVDGLSAKSLSVAHINRDDFYQKVQDGQLLSNEIYIVSGDYVNVYGQQVKNVAMPTDLSDAVNKEYVDEKIQEIEQDSGNFLDKRYGGTISGTIEIRTGGSFVTGEGAQAFGENSFATGENSYAGSRGWYYKAVDTTNKKIYLTDTQCQPAEIKFGSDIGQVTPDSGFTVDSSVIGKRICLVNKNKDDFGSVTVSAIENSTVLVYSGNLVNLSVNVVEGSLDYDDYSIIVSEAPYAGVLDNISKNSFASGRSAIASGRESHAEGRDTFAQGNYSHAEGRNTKALAYVTHAEGIDTFAGLYGTVGSYSHAEGNGVSAIGYASHGEGFKTTASGSTSHSEGNSTEASGAASHAEGYKTTASGDYSHAEGGFQTQSGGSATGAGSHAEGLQTIASGIVAHAEGNQTEASASGSHAEGQKSVASGNYSHAEGNATSAMTEYSHAEGNGSIVSGLWSHVEGYQTSAFGNYSHAEGRQTVAGKAKDGDVAATYAAHAEGFGTKAFGVASHTEGYYVEASNDYEHAQGQYNKSNQASTQFGDAGNTLHSIGIGTSNSNRKNAVEVMQNGDIYIKGLGNYDGTTISNKQNLVQVISGVLQQLDGFEDALDEIIGNGKPPMDYGYLFVDTAPENVGGVQTITLRNYCTQTYVCDPSDPDYVQTFTVAPPSGITKRARDMVLILDCSNITSASDLPKVTWTSVFYPRTDTAIDMIAESGAKNVFYVSEYSPGRFVVGKWLESAGGYSPQV